MTGKMEWTEADVKEIRKNEYDETMRVLAETSPAWQFADGIVRKCFSAGRSKLSLMQVCRMQADPEDCPVDDGEYFLVKVSGGLNGPGNWLVYLEDIKVLFYLFKTNGYKPYLVKLDNDCLDDVFYLDFGVRRLG